LSAWLLSKEPEPPLLDASVRYAERAVTAGVDARLDVWLGMPYGFLGSIGKLKAAAQALDAVGAVLEERLWAGT
jgi:epsilon-lactone hydrolase